MERLEQQLCEALRAVMRDQPGRPPEAGTILWSAFMQLSATRTYHAAGPNPIQPSEIEAFMRIMRLPFEPRHVEVLMAMDRTWLEECRARLSTRAGAAKLPHVSNQALTPELFDLMMT